LLTLDVLVWLRPSKQIRPHLFNMKQKKQRQMIVLKYGVIYIIIFILFAGLIAGRELFNPAH